MIPKKGEIKRGNVELPPVRGYRTCGYAAGSRAACSCSLIAWDTMGHADSYLLALVVIAFAIEYSASGFAPRATFGATIRLQIQHEARKTNLCHHNHHLSLRDAAHQSTLVRRDGIALFSHPMDATDKNNNNKTRIWRRYVAMMRPVTILQAVGAFLVGYLVILSSQQSKLHVRTAIDLSPLSIISAAISIYLSYGVGMAINDVADRDIDSLHDAKRGRSLASNSISMKEGRIFCAVLMMVSVAFAFLAERWCLVGSNAIGHGAFPQCNNFVGWTIINLALMAAYAAGAQKVFLLKNILCGMFAISPLIGAAILGKMQLQSTVGNGIAAKLYQLAAIGFPLQVSREVLKDCEDTEIDRGVKQTLPLVIGISNAKRIAYALVAIVNAGMIMSKYYWKMFASHPPVYAVSVAVGTTMCIAASMLPLEKGQRVLKMSIYVLLAGMISGLLLQSITI